MPFNVTSIYFKIVKYEIYIFSFIRECKEKLSYFIESCAHLNIYWNKSSLSMQKNS